MLYERILQWNASRVSVVGIAKHVGKTTALQTLIDEASGTDRIMSLLSIGVDGERRDAVLGIEKPSITAPEGAWVITAADVMSLGSARLEIVERTEISSPLGDVYITKVRSDGTVMLAGVRQLRQIQQVREQLERLNPQIPLKKWLHLCDGAFGRTASASPKVSDAIILSTGASVSPDMEDVLRQTRLAWQRFRLPLIDEAWQHELLEKANERYENQFDDSRHAVGMYGALTDGVAGQLEDRSVREWLLPDPTHLMLSENTWKRIVRKGIRIHVQKSVPIAAVTINPVSITGYRFPGRVFQERVQAIAESVPVVNCWDSEQ